MVGVETSQWVSAAHLMQCCVLMIIVDSSSKTGSSLQCTFLSPLLNYNCFWYQLTHPVYYRLYTKDGPLESNHPIYSNDRFISRITSTLVRPPQTATSLTKCLCKIEGLEHRKCALYKSLLDNTALDDSNCLLFRGAPRLGPSNVDPVALIVDTRTAEKRSQASNSVESQELLERDYEQRYGATLSHFVGNNLINFQCTIAFTTMIVALSQKRLSTRMTPLWAVSTLFLCPRLTLFLPWKIALSNSKMFRVTMFSYSRMRAATRPWMRVMRSPSLIRSQDLKKTSL